PATGLYAKLEDQIRPSQHRPGFDRYEQALPVAAPTLNVSYVRRPVRAQREPMLSHCFGIGQRPEGFGWWNQVRVEGIVLERRNLWWRFLHGKAVALEIGAGDPAVGFAAGTCERFVLHA